MFYDSAHEVYPRQDMKHIYQYTYIPVRIYKATINTIISQAHFPKHRPANSAGSWSNAWISTRLRTSIAETTERDYHQDDTFRDKLLTR